MLISVVIPTYNRPGLLEEAVASVRDQVHGLWELIIVDDGSSPPVDHDKLEQVAGRKVTLIRHKTAKGVVAAKNVGAAKAQGEVVLYLDDDDLLTPDALATVAGAYQDNHELDCVFLNIETFGRLAKGSARNQAEAMCRLLARVKTTESDELIVLHEGLVDALLESVPLAFQRPAVRRSMMQRIGPMPEHLIFAEPEWTILAAILGRIALTKRPLSKWRVDGQNFASRPEMALEHMRRMLAAREWLWAVVRNAGSELAPHRKSVRRALAMTYQSVALALAQRCQPLAAIGHGLRAWRFSLPAPKVKLLFVSIPYRLLGCLSKRAG
jgi:glycosyltransferase involved in cell wall biosynthesis